MTTEQERDRILKALEVAWKEEEGVRKFGLEYQQDRIAQRNGAWVVPVASGIPTGSSYELGRVLEHLQEITESHSHLEVNVLLTPQLNGH
jgi:hypothetical protein